MLLGFAKRRMSSDAGTVECSDDGEDQKSVGRGLARCSYGGGGVSRRGLRVGESRVQTAQG